MFSPGICGPKIVTLDPGTPSFLNVVQDGSQNYQDSFIIVYSESMANGETDIKMHTIDYTVKFARYSGVNTNELHGSFRFEIIAPLESSMTLIPDQLEENLVRKAPIN